MANISTEWVHFFVPLLPLLHVVRLNGVDGAGQDPLALLSGRVYPGASDRVCVKPLRAAEKSHYDARPAGSQSQQVNSLSG